MCTGVAAEDDGQNAALHSLISTGTNVVASDKGKLSCALDVIAHQNQMAVAGVKGNVLNFTADRFASAMNLGKIDKITITELPDISSGALYIGSNGVSVGQSLGESDIALMTYEEAKSGSGMPARFNIFKMFV